MLILAWEKQQVEKKIKKKEEQIYYRKPLKNRKIQNWHWANKGSNIC